MAKFHLLHQLLLDRGTVQNSRSIAPSASAVAIWSRCMNGSTTRRSASAPHARATTPHRSSCHTPLVQRTWLAVGGTLLTARLALDAGLACHLAGGTHHAHPGFGSGFCIFNDCAVAASVLLAQGMVRQVLVVDLDVHQGDGTAACFASDPRVFTLSVHAASNFPLARSAAISTYPRRPHRPRLHGGHR